MSLLDLPVEIIRQIVDETVSEGLEAFVLTCRSVYACAETQIREHNELKKKWRSVALREYETREATLSILHQISREPLGASYIENLNAFAICDVPSYVSQDDLQEIKSLVLSAPHLGKATAAEREEWWVNIQREIDSENEERENPYTFISLLSLLPNLKTLALYPRIQYQPRDIGKTTTLIGNIIESANADHSTGKALSKLTSLLPSMAPGYEQRTGLQSVEPYLKLKSLTELYLTSCVAVEHTTNTAIPFRWTSPLNQTSLRRIEFSHCCMDANCISEFLSRAPLLEVFRFSHDTKWHGCLHEWNAGAFVAAVGRNCGRTLKHLALSICWLGEPVINGVSSLEEFVGLQSLEVDLAIFCGPPLDAAKKAATSLVEADGWEQIHQWAPLQLKCIPTMLPKSLRSLRLQHVPSSRYSHRAKYERPEEALRVLLKGFRACREEYVPNLEEAILAYGPEKGDAEALVLSVAEAENLSVEFDTERHWQRNFFTRFRST